MKQKLVLILFACISTSCMAQTNIVPTEQCLACHGPFDKLSQKEILVPADPKPVNPHVFVPHDGKDKYYDCVACHTPHPMPPPKGYKDKGAGLDPCYSCHHGEQIQNCKSCHKD